MTIEYLAENYRRPNGKWAKRPAPPKPTTQEKAATRERDRLARQEDRRAARKAARLDRLFDRLVDAVAKIDPDLAKAAADLDAEFREADGE